MPSKLKDSIARTRALRKLDVSWHLELTKTIRKIKSQKQFLKPYDPDLVFIYEQFDNATDALDKIIKLINRRTDKTDFAAYKPRAYFEKYSFTREEIDIIKTKQTSIQAFKTERRASKTHPVPIPKELPHKVLSQAQERPMGNPDPNWAEKRLQLKAQLLKDGLDEK